MKNVKYVLKIALPLIMICTVCAAMLAGINALTAPVIAENSAREKQAAIINLFGDSGLSSQEVACDVEGVNAVYTVTLSDGTVAHCADVVSSSKYGGAVNAMVSVVDGRAANVQIISHSETFMSKYTDGNGKYTGVDCVSGATYSFNAIKDAMRIAEAAVSAVGGAS